MFQAYLISCLIDGKVYVGITSRPLKARWAEHLYDSRTKRAATTVSRAIAKHGAESFRIEAICSARSWDDLQEVEKILIAQYGSLAPNGYNLREGGEGAFGRKPSADAVERSAAKHRGKPCHPNTRAAAIAKKGVKKPDGFGEKIAAARRGTARSEETKAKIAAYWAARREAGEFKTSAPYEHSSRHIGAVFHPGMAVAAA